MCVSVVTFLAQKLYAKIVDEPKYLRPLCSMEKPDLSSICCPCDKKSPLVFSKNCARCVRKSCLHNLAKNGFPIKDSRPVLISSEVCDTVFSSSKVYSLVKRKGHYSSLISKLIWGESQTTKSNCEEFIHEIFINNKYPNVLVIGSGEEGSGTEKLWNNDQIKITGVDVYLSKTVSVIADAQYLPFKEQSFDGVWIQAVLEHVVDPRLAVDEIYRVLKPSGIVYSETPFMQQVHEGAYDFNRFTVTGHRYLFKQFKSLKLGGNKGAEVALAWSIKYFIWSITKNRTLANIIATPFFILLRLCKPLVSKASLFDSSSGVFFLGRKSVIQQIKQRELVRLYDGLQK